MFLLHRCWISPTVAHELFHNSERLTDLRDSGKLFADLNPALLGPPATRVEHLAVEIDSGEFSVFEQYRQE